MNLHDPTGLPTAPEGADEEIHEDPVPHSGTTVGVRSAHARNPIVLVRARTLDDPTAALGLYALQAGVIFTPFFIGKMYHQAVAQARQQGRPEPKQNKLDTAPLRKK